MAGDLVGSGYLSFSFYFYAPEGLALRQQDMATSKDSLLPVLGTLYPWRRHIAYITLGVFILSALLSLLMKNYYQGKSIFYAASQDLFKPEKVFGGGQQEMYYYGSGEDIDRILTVGNSNEVIDYLIDSFDLWTVYKIKPGTPKARYKMRKAFRENFNILLTKQDALELTVEDTDPERAAAMTNAATARLDFLVKSIIKNSQIALSSSYQKSITNKERIMQGTLDTLIYYRQKTGIYDPEGQTEILATRVTEVTNAVEREKASLESLKGMNLSSKLRDSIQILQARITGYERELAILNGTDNNSNYSLKNFNNSKGRVELLESRYLRSYEQIGYDLEKLKLYNAAVEIDVPALHMIEKAEVPLYKQRPRRSIIVIACTLAAFLFSLAAVLAIESYKQMDWTFLEKK
jgi:tyrosine-protein kinase Etk/Wzc